MPVLDLQQAQTEVGRIRLGVKVGAGRGRPTKLDRFRFTSPRKALIEKIAELYGGKVEPWQPPRGSAQWQVITNTAEVPVMVPPQDPAESQWYELWSAGGCLRRCDGRKEKISGQSCLCDTNARDCKIHTRLRVMLEDVPGLGAWRVDTGSYYAAVELPSVASLLAQAQGIIPATLVLDQRTVTRQVDGKPQTMNFAVPVLHVEEITPAQLVSGRVQELITARRAAAIGGTVTAITAAPSAAVDYAALIDAAKNKDGLRDLYRQANAAGALTDDLRARFERAAEALESAQPHDPRPAVIDAEVAPDHRDVLLDEILAESPWAETADLEREFIAHQGVPMRDADEAKLRRFLTALKNGFAGVTRMPDRLAELVRLLGVAELRGDDARRYINDLIGRVVDSLDELSPDEVETAVTAVERFIAQQEPAVEAA
jgi:hypothetical protein